MRVLGAMFIVVVAIAVGCGTKALPESTVGVQISGEPEIRFVGPDGFEWREEHKIWYNKSLRCSVETAYDGQANFQAICDEFETDRMQAGNLELVSKEVKDIGGRSMLIVHSDRIGGNYPQQAITVAYPAEGGCAQLTAIFPRDLDQKMKDEIEKALLESQCTITK